MGGRASVIMVMGFIIILSIYQLNMARRSVEVVENVVDAYIRTAAHQIAVSGTNIAASRLYQDMTWRTGASAVPFQGGNFSISFGAGADTVEVIIVSTFRDYSDTIRAYFSGSRSYTDYAVFTDDENGMAWTPGDTVWGPMHTNGVFNHQNNASIVFYGKVTAGKNIASPPKNSKTQFMGGYEVGVFLPAVSGMTGIVNAAVSGGYTFPAPADTMKLEFKSNGNLVIYQNSLPLFPDPGTPLSTIAPNGSIYSAGPIEILGGVVNTTAAGLSVGSGNSIIFRDEVQYADNPETNPSSDDLVAFVSQNSIYLDNQTKNNWDMQAILMAVDGSLTATNMTKEGTFTYYGSYAQKNRGNAKMFQSFNKKYKYDERLRKKKPPFYPGMSNLSLVAWWE